jgi:hypothetical protein
MSQTERKPHVHAEIIKAWADGAKIEVECNGYWVPLSDRPCWYETVKYRIKPERIEAGKALEECWRQARSLGDKISNEQFWTFAALGFLEMYKAGKIKED